MMSRASPTLDSVTLLETLTPSTRVSGLTPGRDAEILSARWHGGDALVNDERDGLRQRLSERTPDGQFALSGALLKEVNDRFNELTDEQIPRAQHAVNKSGETLLAHIDALRNSREGMALSAVLGFVAALRDPFDVSYRDLIHKSVRNLTITTHHRRVNGRSRQLLKINLEFIIRDGDNVLVVPVEAEHVEKVLASDWESGDRILRELQSRPTTFIDVVPRSPRVGAHALAARLDMNGTHLMLPRIRDPRLTQLVALVLDNEDLTAVAEATGESLALIERIYEVHHSSRQSTWCRGPGPLVYAIHGAADATGKVVRANGLPPSFARWTDIQLVLNAFRERAEWIYDKRKWTWTLHPCPHCGSTRRRPASIPEPVGLVCLDCRRDVAGHVWDGHYDAYLVPSGTSIAVSATKGLRGQRSLAAEDRTAHRLEGGSVSHAPRTVKL